MALQTFTDRGNGSLPLQAFGPPPTIGTPDTEDYTERGEEVREDIRSLYPPGHMRDRMLDGLWAGAVGLVLNCFDPAKHIIPFERQSEIQIGAGWDHWRTTDWGYGDPTYLLMDFTES